MAIHSRSRAWEIPWTEEPGRLQSMGSRKRWTWHDLVTKQQQRMLYDLAVKEYFWRQTESQTLLLVFSCQVISYSFVTPRTVACQAPLSMGFPRQEYWSGLPFTFPGDLSNPGIELRSPAWQADSLPLSYQEDCWGSKSTSATIICVKWRELLNLLVPQFSHM